MRGAIAFVGLLVLVSAVVHAVQEEEIVLDRFSTGLDSLNGWSAEKRAEVGDGDVTVAFVVSQKNEELIESMFWERTNPDSVSFGKWLSREEIGEIVANREGTAKVMEFLQMHNVSEVAASPFGEYIKAKIPVHVAAKILSAEFKIYSHAESKNKIIKTQEYVIPEELRGHVSHVSHVSYFPRVHHLRSSVVRPTVFSTSADDYVTPALLKSYYNIDDNVVKSSENVQAVFESLGQDYAPKDLAKFQKQFKLLVQDISKVIGENEPEQCYTDADACGEANLDVQYIMAVAQNASTIYWDVPGETEPFLDWVMAVAAEANPPLVHSISYGGYEDETSAADKKSFNLELQKLALRGVSVLISSGDDGAANYNARSNSKYCGYHPSFPASSPYATAVGATQGPEAGSSHEIACQASEDGLITTGGGFSSYYAAPSYQKSQIANYFKVVSKKPYRGYHKKGRAIPDVSILGRNYVIAIGGKWTLVSGTSASAPVFAGMITVVNDHRIRAGKSPLGFLNQILYKLPTTVWNDVTEGNNLCTAEGSTGSPICCKQGFYAAKGWDPVTGLGSPKFDKFLQALLHL